MGGVAGFALILGMVRTKFSAILIGAGGVGLFSNFTAIQGVMSAITGLGIQSSAVRDIAEAVAMNNENGIGRIVLSLRRICRITGCFGMVCMVLLSPLISQWTFGSVEYRWDIAALGVAILLANIQGGQIALIQGMRRMGDLAKVQILGALVGTFATIGLYFFLGIRGIIPAIVFMSSIQLLISWQVAKKIKIKRVKMSWIDSFLEGGGMVRLGVVMMWAGLMGSLATYVTNAMITEQINLQAVGIYSAAMSLSGIVVNFILNAMTADYYPRLSAVSSSHILINKTVNEQTEIGLLLAAPGLMATIVLAPFAIEVFYSKEFTASAYLLQWMALGCLGRVISWPLAFIMLALNNRKLFFFTETGGQLLNICLIYFGLQFFGLTGLAIGFTILNAAYVAITFLVARCLTDFHWSNASKKILIRVSVLVILIFCGENFLPSVWGTALGVLLTFIGAIFSMWSLKKHLGNSHPIVNRLLKNPSIKYLFNLCKIL